MEITAQEICKACNDSYRVRKATESVVEFLLKDKLVLRHCGISPFIKRVTKSAFELWAYDIRLNWDSDKKSTLGNLLSRITENFKDTVKYTYFDKSCSQVTIRMKKGNFIYRRNKSEWDSNE